METELKLQVPPAQLDQIRQHPMLAAQAFDGAHEHQLVDTYYDTAGHDLWKRGLTLRVRESAGAWIQTVKTAAATSPGLHERGEWECALPNATPQPALLARQIKPAALSTLLSRVEAGQLEPIFRNVTRRTSWLLKWPDGDEVECVLDSGRIESGGNHAEIAELELEIKHGSSTHLFELALALHADIPLRMSNDSKAARGFAMLSEVAAHSVKAQPVKLGRHATLEDTFQQIGLNCLRQMEANVPGVLQKDVESLHQMRVGLRRLRALIDMFEELAPAPAQIAEGLDWLAEALGATRDWDVLADSTLARIHGIDPGALRLAARARADKLHQAMLQTLHSARFTEVLLSVNGWLHGRQWRDETTLPAKSPLANPAAKACLPLLRKAEKRLSRRIAGFDGEEPHQRHRIRIAAKKARYGAEFFRDLLPAKEVKRYVARLSELQDHLGLLNDFAVAGQLLPELQKGNGELGRQAAYARGYLVAASEADSSELAASLKAVAKLRLPR
ncbi:CYTH and CHAD domain-containing protein [Telluria aromaticivorans]|uniref:CHAD domain-containing protein n=1 Tax=Telluria aromaticivorans TaxID=2725995 RepID=A0A7Y2K3E0_9BURK|nr:CYTH and CHAD domain-containing protein [Telluria aromaticivorans]NNG25598.1 CHAD domain-containing protein [Telluria aromaticivorans]